MARAKKNKVVEEIKNLEPVTNETNKVEEIKETEVITNDESVEILKGKEYVVVLGTPSFYVIKLSDGTMKTIQGSNTYKRGDIVKL